MPGVCGLRLRPTGARCGKPRECHLCFLYETHEGHNRVWGGDGRVRHDPELAAHWDAILTTAPQPRREPCRHLGAETGERRECPSCTGNVQIKLFACAKHGVCSVARNVGAACCATCPH